MPSNIFIVKHRDKVFPLARSVIQSHKKIMQGVCKVYDMCRTTGDGTLTTLGSQTGQFLPSGSANLTAKFMHFGGYFYLKFTSMYLY